MAVKTAFRQTSTKTILLTNATTGAGLAAVKALVTAGYKVITADCERLPFGLRSRYSSANHILPGRSEADYENALLDLVFDVKPDAFLPLGTRSVFIASKNRERIKAITGVNVPALDGFQAAHCKAVCIAECRQLGIPCPKVYSPAQAYALLEQDRKTILVVKPDRDIGAARGVHYVTDARQLRTAVSECTDLFGGVLIEEYIPGGAASMKTVVVLFSRDSRLVAAFTTQKVRQWPPSGGLTAVSRRTANDQLVKQVLPFFEKWRWSGAAEVELKFDSRDGQDKVIEINPRFPAYLRFPIECGINFAVMAADLSLVADVPSVSLSASRIDARFVNPGLLLRSVYSDLRARGLRDPEFGDGLRQLIAAIPIVVRGLADPLPLLGRALARVQAAFAKPRLFLIGRETGGRKWAEIPR